MSSSSQPMIVRPCSIINSLDRLVIYGGKNIRIVGTFEEPWFCGKDVASVLGYSRPRDAITDHVRIKNVSKLCDVMKSANMALFKGNEKASKYINEKGLLELIK